MISSMQELINFSISSKEIPEYRMAYVIGNIAHIAQLKLCKNLYKKSATKSLIRRSSNNINQIKTNRNFRVICNSFASQLPSHRIASNWQKKTISKDSDVQSLSETMMENDRI